MLTLKNQLIFHQVSIVSNVESWASSSSVRQGYSSDVHTWLVTVMTGSEDPKYCERKETVFITEGVDLGQLQREVESRFGNGQRVDILEIKTLGPLGNRRA